VAKRRSVIERDGGDQNVYGELSAIMLLAFATDPEHPNYGRARSLDRQLTPARDAARAALSSASPSRRGTPELRRARDRAWQLIERAGETIDMTPGCWLHEDGSTVGWARRRVAALLRRDPRRLAE
jgi:hypothetical protein